MSQCKAGKEPDKRWRKDGTLSKRDRRLHDDGECDDLRRSLVIWKRRRNIEEVKWGWGQDREIAGGRTRIVRCA